VCSILEHGSTNNDLFVGSQGHSKKLTPLVSVQRRRTTGTETNQEQETTMSNVSDMINSIRNNDVAQVKQLLQSDSIDLIDGNPISCASSRGFTEIVQLLLKDGRADPTDDDNYALYSACKNGHVEVVKALLQDPRVDPSVNNNEAIRWASSKGHTEVVRLLLQDPRVDPTPGIPFALSMGHDDIVELLFSSGLTASD